MKLHHWAALAACSLMTACATAPGTYNVQRMIEVDGEYEAVWSHLVQFFAVNNIDIRTLERDSGLIAAESSYGEADFAPFTQYADCGGPVASQTLGELNWNVFARETSEGRIHIQVNTRFTRSYTSVWTGQRVVDTCASRGTIERQIIDWMRMAPSA